MAKRASEGINCLIVDDQLLNIEVMRDLLTELDPRLVIKGVATNGREALDLINEYNPDLVFLDVEMPDMSGFDVLRQLDTISFQTIFVTAYSHYAIQAIRFNALDYLLKPVDKTELALAIKRFRRKGHREINREHVKVALKNLKKSEPQSQILYIPTMEGGYHLRLEDIAYIKGDRNYSIFKLQSGKTRMASKTLAFYQDILETRGFFRCHRSTLINRTHLKGMSRSNFILKDESKVPISRRRMSEAKRWYSRGS